MVSLSDLPTEILCRIAQPLLEAWLDFEDHGICSLRLTCRALRLRTQYEFGKAAFSTIRLDLHPRSLEHLVSVSKQPAFGRAIRKLVFAHSADEKVSFPFIERDEDVLELSSFEEQIRFVLRRIFGDSFKGMPNLKEILIITPFVARFQQPELFFDAKESLKEDEDDDAMADAFEDSTDGFQSFKVNQNCITNDSLYALLTEAVLKNGTQLASFEYNDAPPRNLSIQHAPAYSMYYGTFAQSIPALRYMQNIKLNICFRKFSWPDASVDKKQVSVHQDFGQMFNLMSQLVSLDLKFDGYHKSIEEKLLILQAMNTTESINLPRLTSLTIRDTPITEFALAALLRNHKESLRCIALRNVQIVSLGTWQAILTLLLCEMPALHELFLYWMRQGSRDVFDRVKVQGSFSFTGRKEVTAGLRSLLENMDMMLG